MRITENTRTMMVGTTEIGIYEKDGITVLIDTGSEENPEFMEYLDEEGIYPDAIINTHLHVDHVGCNNLIADEYDCPIYADQAEIDDTFFSGDLKPCDDAIAFENGQVAVPEGSDNVFKIISLPGHSPGHSAIVTPDGVCFLGDTVTSPRKLSTLKLPYHLDADGALKSMYKAKELDYQWYVLCHRGVYFKEEIGTVIDLNIRKEEEIMELTREIVQASPRLQDEKLAMILMTKVGIVRARQDVFWIMETALSRIKEARRQLDL